MSYAYLQIPVGIQFYGKVAVCYCGTIVFIPCLRKMYNDNCVDRRVYISLTKSALSETGLDWDWKTSLTLKPRPAHDHVLLLYLYFFALCRGRLTGRSGNLPTLPTASPTLVMWPQHQPPSVPWTGRIWGHGSRMVLSGVSSRQFQGYLNQWQVLLIWWIGGKQIRITCSKQDKSARSDKHTQNLTDSDRQKNWTDERQAGSRKVW